MKIKRYDIGDTGIEVLAKHYSNKAATDQLLELVDFYLNNLIADGMMKIMRSSEPYY